MTTRKNPKNKAPRSASDGLVAGYVRKSVVNFPAEWTVEQRQAHVEQLRRDRVAELTADAGRDGERIDVWYDDMSVSGRGEFLYKRVDFARATRDAKAGKIRRLYARDLARLFRKLLHQELWFDEMEEAGCEVRARDLPENRNSSDSKMMRQMLGMANEWKAERDSDDMRAKMVKFIEDGWLGRVRAQWGFLYDKETRAFLPCPETAPQVLRLFEMFVQTGFVACRTADILNAAMLGGEPGAFLAPRGAYWSQSSVLRIIRSPVYRRCVTWGEMVVPRPEKIPEIVPPAIAEEAARGAAGRAKPESGGRRAGAIPYTYSGMLTCGLCAGAMKATGTTKVSDHNPRPTARYMCHAGRTSRARCPDAFHLSHLRLDGLVGRALQEALARASSPQDLANGLAASAPATTWRRRPAAASAHTLAGLDAQADRYREMYAAGSLPYTLEQLTRDLGRVEEKRRGLLEKQRQSEAAPPESWRLSAAQWQTLLATVSALWHAASGTEGTLRDPIKALRDPNKGALLRRLGVRIAVTVLPKPREATTLRGSKGYQFKRPRRDFVGGRARLVVEIPALGLSGERAIVITETEEEFRRHSHNPTHNHNRRRQNGTDQVDSA